MNGDISLVPEEPGFEGLLCTREDSLLNRSAGIPDGWQAKGVE